jgi:hypothetical protein
MWGRGFCPAAELPLGVPDCTKDCQFVGIGSVSDPNMPARRRMVSKIYVALGQRACLKMCRRRFRLRSP